MLKSRKSPNSNIIYYTGIEGMFQINIFGGSAKNRTLHTPKLWGSTFGAKNPGALCRFRTYDPIRVKDMLYP